MCLEHFTESVIASIERLTPREKQEIRDYLPTGTVSRRRTEGILQTATQPYRKTQLTRHCGDSLEST